MPHWEKKTTALIHGMPVLKSGIVTTCRKNLVEPQMELVYGSVSGKSFNWEDRMALTMKTKL